MNEDYMFEDENDFDNNGNFSQDNQNFNGGSNNGYTGYNQGPMDQKEPIGMAIASFVLGIVSVVLFLIGINVITAIVGIVLGIIFIVTRTGKRGKVFAWIGVITSFLGIGLFIAAWTFMIANSANIAKTESELIEMFEEYDLEGDYQDIFGDDYLYENPNGDDLGNYFDGELTEDDWHPESPKDETF